MSGPPEPIDPEPRDDLPCEGCGKVKPTKLRDYRGWSHPVFERLCDDCHDAATDVCPTGM